MLEYSQTNAKLLVELGAEKYERGDTADAEASIPEPYYYIFRGANPVIVELCVLIAVLHRGLFAKLTSPG